jgi:hypothetical protein
MKTAPDALRTAKNEFGSVKNEKGTRRPHIPSKTSPKEQNMKTGLDAPSIVENKSGSAKHENWTRPLWYRRKQVRERKT